VKWGLLVRRNLLRRPGRSALTVLGVASATLLLALVEGLSAGLDRALSGSEAARTLVVYRQNRYCPQTSFLPERYTAQIERVPGVESVLPVKVFLSNCRASLDIVAFQGAPVDRLFDARDLELLEGDVEVFRRERDAALIGREFAARRGLSVGDKFRLGSIDVKIAGVFASSEPVEEGVVLTHLEFLQRAGPVDRLGTVTEYEVKVTDSAQAERVAQEIDAMFATAEEPTGLALGCVAVVLALVGNTVMIAVVERSKEMGVLRTLGFRGRHLLFLVLGEGVAYGLLGYLLGIGGALLLIQMTHLSIGAEGVPVSFLVSTEVALRALALSLGAALLAALVPAVQASRVEVVKALRSA
jgi:putative ABC transport system permease protein